MPYLLFLLYNLLALIVTLIALPVLLVVIVSKKKYRTRVLRRLGWKLEESMAPLEQTEKKTIWIHALSVGETTSALPLIKGIREQYPDARLIFSVTTRSGEELAQKSIAPFVDALVASPLDTALTIKKYISVIKPDLFVLVETDFWPNWLFLLKQNNIPVMLVNGRISAKSLKRYTAFPLFFRTFFSLFTILSMQTERDAQVMKSLGLNQNRIHTLGNLKLDTTLLADAAKSTSAKRHFSFVQPPSLLFICGSTHEGEEELLFKALKELRTNAQPVQMLLAPRDIGRSDALVTLAEHHNFTAARKTALSGEDQVDVCILDTIGELAAAYQAADIAFIGGSLVAQGGHNPLEAAVQGIPVIFGKHMEDFAEIAEDLVQHHGAVQVHSSEVLLSHMKRLCENHEKRKIMGMAAQQWVRAHQGVVTRHLDIIDQLLWPT